MTARDEILRRIRAAAAGSETRPVPRAYAGPAGRGDPERFAERLGEYRATVHLVASSEVHATLGAALSRRGVRRLVVPEGVPPGLLETDELTLVRDDPRLSPRQLDALDGVLTTCALAIEATGTLVLDHGPGQGRRALTLVPDYHLVVVEASQIVAGVPDAVAALKGAPTQTWISGPSATSDIELDRVEGVHGPRNLEVVVVTGPERASEEPVQPRTAKRRSPTGDSSSLTTDSTKARGGPEWHQEIIAATEDGGPSKAASTLPSGRLRTKPLTPCSSACWRQESRK